MVRKHAASCGIWDARVLVVIGVSLVSWRGSVAWLQMVKRPQVVTIPTSAANKHNIYGTSPRVTVCLANGAPTALLASLCAAVAWGGSLRVSKRRRLHKSNIVCQAGIEPGAGGAIETFLVRGPVDAASLAIKCAPLAGYFDLSCVAFFSMGVDASLISSVAGGSLGLHGVCPVYIANAKGVVGWDTSAGENVEIREDGGEAEGVVVVAFRGGGHTPSCTNEIEEMPDNCAIHMMVSTAGKPAKPETGAIYGGVADACYKLEHSGDLMEVQQFAISTPMAVLTSFSNEAGAAASSALRLIPEVARPPIAAGYFACPAEDSAAHRSDIAALAAEGLEGVRLFGLFAPALGPPTGSPVICVPELTTWTSILDPDPRPEIEVHSSASVLALYGK